MQIFFVVCALFLGANALTKEQFEAYMKEAQAIGTACAAEEHAQPGDLEELMAYKIPPSSHTAKCILACFYEHLKMMKSDGTFDKQAAIETFNELKTVDAELHGKIMKIIDTCDGKKKILDDRCETASLMATCVKTEAEALGITKEAFLATK